MELTRKLARHAQEGDDLEALLDVLEAAKFLSQARFADSLVNRRAKKFGNDRVLSELHSHGIKGEALQGIKAALAIDETTRARQVWSKKFEREPLDSAERVKQMRFLQQRGFSSRAIQAVMRGQADQDE
ncbi:hypothetical protein BH11PSE11_BH11PSE11_00700 [soil metagenome]